MSLIFTIIIIIILVIAASAIAMNKGKGQKSVDKKYAYTKKKTLFTKTEQKFHDELKQIVGKNYEVHGKVRLEDIITVKKGTEKKEANALRGRIRPRHIDFTLCKAKNSSIIAVIELDDKTHNTKKAKKADDFKNKALKDAGVHLIRFKVADSYKEEIIKELKKLQGRNV